MKLLLEETSDWNTTRLINAFQPIPLSKFNKNF